MRRRFLVSTVLTVPLLVIAMGGHLAPGALARRLPGSVLQSGLGGLALATPVVLWGGWPFFVRGWSSVVHRSLNMFTLIAHGRGRGLWIQPGGDSVAGLFPASFREAGGEVPVYFDAAAVITTLVLLGQVLELRARSRRSGAFGRCWAWPPRPRDALREDGARRMSRWSRCSRATACGFAPAKKFRWMEWCWKERAAWTSP